VIEILFFLKRRFKVLFCFSDKIEKSILNKRLFDLFLGAIVKIRIMRVKSDKKYQKIQTSERKYMIGFKCLYSVTGQYVIFIESKN